ncbi:MAG: glycosyltransferase family 39 protein, partial [Planctomycetes bacterium]|nr:glycosyltransferase family 39 protein [Planctomycetota bacterium]
MNSEMTTSTVNDSNPNPRPRFFRKPCFWLGSGLFLLALVLRLAYIIEYNDQIGIQYYRFDQTDNHTFQQWAVRIAQGDWLCREQIHPYHRWTAEVAPEDQWLQWYGRPEIYHQAPLYPYLAAVLYVIFGTEVIVVQVFQAIMGAFTCLLVFLTGRWYFGRNAGVLAGLFLALAGFHFYYDAFVLRENLIAFLTIAFIFLSSRAFKNRRPGLFAGAGMLLGLGMAAKPTAMVLLPLYLSVLIFGFRDERWSRKG